jgi:hypothetical protein
MVGELSSRFEPLVWCMAEGAKERSNSERLSSGREIELEVRVGRTDDRESGDGESQASMRLRRLRGRTFRHSLCDAAPAREI